ncbi:MAG: Response regulators consisting of a CheY-like receiver domain and a winged-helix DNA-binding domain [Marinobacter excellens HL-55]|uniref:Response regulators consisting of a CheY-like receiver domain and a winged-helix DNA-binding domain n=1 Tax=Marinobacter excellens HL-55 TaxID=1305731 RepID=A0A0P8CZS1_9GAMM|nr:MAG: Response regulators consisting of a CheY-like receiver domain and a winged-helix DNA-binding domain [Marinobacter excellens HL-55]
MALVTEVTLNKVLYVEDDPDIRAIAELALQDVGGFEAALCSSGQQALEVAPEFGPDLILLDVMMPEMDGPETLNKLRNFPETRSTPVIFMTARIQSSEIEEYLALGAIGVIPKPFDPMTLADDIRHLVRERVQR